MLSDEEKKAVVYLKSYCINDVLYDNKHYEQIKTVLNLIEKQSKEIEELKEKNRQEKIRIVQLENEITARIEDVNQYYTPNDKIKAKIEEIKEEKRHYLEINDEYNAQICDCIIEEYESLLEKE